MSTNLFSKICVSLAFVLATVNFVSAQEETSEAASSGVSIDLGSDFVSRYIWRGVNLGGSSPHFQPWVELSTDFGLAVGYWGSFSTAGLASGAGAEADLYLSYTPIDMFSVIVTDYFFPVDAAFSSDRYFTDWFNNDSSAHTFEAAVSFNGTETLPLTFMFAMNVYGFDAINKSGDKVMSKYAEIGYSKTIGEADFGLTLGFSLDDPDEQSGEAGFYTQESMGLINLGLSMAKEIKISESYSLPISSSVIFNPERENIYMVFGISF